MLFLVISDPRPEAPSGVQARRREFWRWIEPLREAGEVRSVFARVGRGAVVLFEVPTLEALHGRLTEWSNMIPAEFALYPLLEAAAAQRFLAAADGDPGGS